MARRRARNRPPAAAARRVAGPAQVGHRLATATVRRGVRGPALAEGIWRPRRFTHRAADLLRRDGAGARPVRRRELRRHVARGTDPHRRGDRRAEGARTFPRSCGATRCGAKGSPSPARVPISRRCGRSAERDGDDYILNGQKIWCSFGQIADVGEFLVRTDPEAPKNRGISWLILPMDLPGIEIRPLKTVLGSSEFAEVFLTDVCVPVANRVGDENDGWRVTNVTLKYERGTAFVSELVDSIRLAEDLARYRVATHMRHRNRERARPLHRRFRRVVGADEAQRVAGESRNRRTGRDGDEARLLRGAAALRRALPQGARTEMRCTSTTTSSSRSDCERSR